MKTIQVAWQEKDGHPALAVQFPRMFPFQIEEIERVAGDLGFVVEGEGHQRALGALTGVWSVPGPGAAVSSANAVAALREALAKIGYEIEHDNPVEEPVGQDAGKDKTTLAVEEMTRSLDRADLDADQKPLLEQGKQLSEAGKVDEAFHLLRDLGKPIWEAETQRALDQYKTIVATWLKEPVGALRLSYPLDLSEDERLLVERLGTIFGFAINDDIWIAPAGGEDIVAWRNELSAAGIETQFQDSAEVVRATHKTLVLKSLDPEKVAPFEVNLSEFSETEKSAIQKAAWECRFQLESNILTPPDMNESYLMFRDKMREAGFLLKIIHGDKP
ncbi:hypothetical protein ELG63_36280 [Rhizobium leguminosarum]|uniref:hypothetical protein n=1 Tax=Rhizobium leguminosarum TaxID=384 RepID=UPI00102F62BB|nr:hypothetical protein [Rhizobium leguminosarum]TBH28147.1 hypothetical protein ELG63_36280 [Rhizobium leguminosarum]